MKNIATPLRYPHTIPRGCFIFQNTSKCWTNTTFPRFFSSKVEVSVKQPEQDLPPHERLRRQHILAEREREQRYYQSQRTTHRFFYSSLFVFVLLTYVVSYDYFSYRSVLAQQLIKQLHSNEKLSPEYLLLLCDFLLGSSSNPSTLLHRFAPLAMDLPFSSVHFLCLHQSAVDQLIDYLVSHPNSKVSSRIAFTFHQLLQYSYVADAILISMTSTNPETRSNSGKKNYTDNFLKLLQHEQKLKATLSLHATEHESPILQSWIHVNQIIHDILKHRSAHQYITDQHMALLKQNILQIWQVPSFATCYEHAMNEYVSVSRDGYLLLDRFPDLRSHLIQLVEQLPSERFSQERKEEMKKLFSESKVRSRKTGLMDEKFQMFSISVGCVLAFSTMYLHYRSHAKKYPFIPQMSLLIRASPLLAFTLSETVMSFLIEPRLGAIEMDSHVNQWQWTPYPPSMLIYHWIIYIAMLQGFFVSPLLMSGNIFVLGALKSYARHEGLMDVSPYA